VLLLLPALAFSKSLTPIAAALCFGSLFGALGGLLVLKKRIPFVHRPLWHPAAWKHWLKLSLPVAAGVFFASAYIKAGMLMLPWLDYAHETGLYGAAQRLFEAGYMVPAALMAVTLPRLSKIAAENPLQLRKEGRKIGGFVLGMALFTLAAGEAFAAPVLQLLFGDKYGPSIPILRVLILVNAMAMVNYFLMTLLVIFNRQLRYSIHEAVSLVVTVVLTYFFVRRQGAPGAAWALVATEGLLFVLTVYALRQTFPTAKEVPGTGIPGHA
jgi:O-antigen/teichoic acid export membrane protein